MIKKKSYQFVTMALLAATIVSILFIFQNESSVHAASILKKSFSLKEGTISGFLTPTDASSLLRTASTQKSSSTSGLLDQSDIHYFVVTGQLVGTHYTYPLEFGSNPGQKIGVVEISNDSVAHTQTIAVGTPTDKLLHPVKQGGSSLEGQGQQKTAKSAPLISNAGGSATHHFTTTWTDPVGINVNSVEDTISYNYNGSIVTSYSGTDNRWWLSNDGWYEASHYIGSGYTGSGSNPQTLASVWTGDTMENDIFCVGNSTYVYYSNNVVNAQGNGSAYGSINTWDGGGCSGLLHYGTAFS